MSYKRNAGRKQAKRNMANAHVDASFMAYLGSIVNANQPDWEEFLDAHKREVERVCGLNPAMLIPSRPSMEEKTALAARLSASQFTGLSLLDPFSTVRIDSGMGKSVTLQEGLRRELEVVAARTGIPPLFAPRDNGHRQSREDREMYDELSAQNTYLPPPRTNDKFGRPDWGPDQDLVDGRHPDAGQWGKLCYRTACQKPNAFYYNTGSRKHYCRECADVIDRENMLGVRLHKLAAFEGQHA